MKLRQALLQPFLIATLITWVAAARVEAVPPLVTDDPLTAENQQFEVYAGMEYLSEDHTITRQIPAFELNYGLTERLQLTLTMPYLSTQGAEGFGDVTLEEKFNFIKDHKMLPDTALVLEWTLPTGSFRRGLGVGAAQYFLHVPMQKSWGWFTALGDFGHTFVREPSIDGMREARKDTWFIGFAQKYELAKQTHLISEIYWETNDEPGKPNRLAASLGLEQQIVKDLDLEFAIGRSLREGALGGPDLRVYVGLHWVFDAPWKHEEKEKQK